MLAIDCDGNLFPCIRFYDFSLNNRDGLKIGDIYKGIDEDKVRPFLGLTLTSQSTRECIECEVATGCSWCQGNNFDTANTDTIYQRATFICKMHKANVRANKYFWDKFEKVTGLESERKRVEAESVGLQTLKYLQFITSDKITPHCCYRNLNDFQNTMSEEILLKGLEFCKTNRFMPVMLGTHWNSYSNIKNDYLTIGSPDDRILASKFIPVYDISVEHAKKSENCILLVNKNNLDNVVVQVQNLYNCSNRVNVVLEDIAQWNEDDIKKYQEQLCQLTVFLADNYKNQNKLELNVLTDIWNLKSMRNCESGVRVFALAPNGRIYICPAFYFDDPDSHVGTLDSGINIKNPHLFELENAPICSSCDVYNCKRCKYLNRKLTREFNTPSKIQCVISHIERNQARELQKIIMEKSDTKFENILTQVDYLDPLEKLLK